MNGDSISYAQQHYFFFFSSRSVSIAPSFIPMDSFLGSSYPFAILLTITSDICPKTASMFCPVLAELSMKRSPFFLAVLKP